MKKIFLLTTLIALFTNFAFAQKGKAYYVIDANSIAEPAIMQDYMNRLFEAIQTEKIKAYKNNHSEPYLKADLEDLGKIINHETYIPDPENNPSEMKTREILLPFNSTQIIAYHVKIKPGKPAAANNPSANANEKATAGKNEKEIKGKKNADNKKAKPEKAKAKSKAKGNKNGKGKNPENPETEVLEKAPDIDQFAPQYIQGANMFWVKWEDLPQVLSEEEIVKIQSFLAKKTEKKK